MSNNASTKTVKYLLISCMLMFAFAFLQVPLYGLFCKITGINGKIEKDNRGISAAATTQQKISKLDLQFFSSNAEKVNWDFKPSQNRIEIQAGKNYQTYFVAKNNNSFKSKIQAVPSVTPAAAAPYLHKMECFCFTQQLLEAHEEKKMGLSFAIDPNLPEDIKTITLTYSLFNLPLKSSTSSKQQMYSALIPSK